MFVQKILIRIIAYSLKLDAWNGHNLLFSTNLDSEWNITWSRCFITCISWISTWRHIESYQIVWILFSTRITKIQLIWNGIINIVLGSGGRKRIETGIRNYGNFYKEHKLFIVILCFVRKMDQLIQPFLLPSF